MLKLGLIGIGAAGNQVILTALNNDIDPKDLLAVNSSKIDLTALEDKVDTLVLGGKGCGKDIAIAQKTIKAHLKDNIEAFNKFKAYDMLYITGSTGGGTSAGMMTILATVLKQVLKMRVGLLPIIPKHNETLAAQNNTLLTLREIEKISRELSIPYMIYDNQTVSGSPVKVYSKINKEIINDFKILRGDMNEYSPHGIIDEMDNTKLLVQPGMMRIGKVSGIKQVYTEKTPIHQLICDALTSSVNVASEKDRVIGRMGYYLNLNENLLEEFDDQNSSVIEKIGRPKAFYSQLNLIQEDQEGSVAVLMTGLSFPKTRVSEIVEILENAKEDIVKKIEEDTYVQEKAEETLSWFDNGDQNDLLNNTEQENETKITLDDIMQNL